MSLRNLLGAVALTVLCLAQSAFAAPDTVNVNTADAETLAAMLDGVGLSRAQAIVQYRESNGSFGDLYDLANVKGIGDRTIELNAERIRLAD